VSDEIVDQMFEKTTALMNQDLAEPNYLNGAPVFISAGKTDNTIHPALVDMQNKYY